MHEKETAPPFFIPFLLSSPLKEKSMGGHGEAIGYVCVSGKPACVCTQHDSPGPRSSPLCGAPEGPERTAHTVSIDYTPTHHFRQSRDLTVTEGVCFVVFLHVILAAEMSHVSSVSEAHLYA